jgi:FRG domain-containing protein
MAAKRKSIIRSWLDLARLAQKLAGEEWVFRGEASARHALRPGSGRVGNELGATRRAEFTEADERAALHRFKNDALPYLTYHPAQGRDLEWLAIAQHHGMQTRLLDWTESLLIAAFFAVERVASDGRGVIYGIKNLPVVEGDADPFDIAEISVYRPSHITPRIAPQWSVFTVHPRPTEDFRRSGMITEWHLAGSRASRQIKQVLDSCGINYASIYPDLTGLARHIYWRYKWGMRQTKSVSLPKGE